MAGVADAATQPGLRRLAALLAEDDAAAYQAFQSCAASLRQAFGDRVDELAQLLEAFDYPLALERVRGMLADIDAECHSKSR